MASYAIGDVQGCYDELIQLLDLINYDQSIDQLYFVGDLVNRGPNSLSVLRLLKDLLIKPIITLGNHDLHLLAVHAGVLKIKRKDSFDDILSADDCDALCHWLRMQKLFYYQPDQNIAFAHAGIAPQWPIEQALALAAEVETVLHSPNTKTLFEHMYGDKPNHWDDTLTGWPRLRVIINYFTRMRFCDPEGRLNLTKKHDLSYQSRELIPWFKLPNRQNSTTNIIFGHWASLRGKANTDRIFALDTGCVWGGTLTAMRLEDNQLFSVKSQQ